MKFQCNTKPFADALALGVVNQNISNFDGKSQCIQLKATRGELTMNLEARLIRTEIRMKGAGDADSSPTVSVDCRQLKSLSGTLDSSTITLDITDSGLVVQSGKSVFTLPSIAGSSEIELTPPNASEGLIFTDIAHSDWKFIQDNQLYALSMSFLQPVYTRVWNGESGDVLSCDLDRGLVTHSKKGSLHQTCLLEDTIVNLLTAVPEDAKIAKTDSGYVVMFSADSYTYLSEFTPLHEDAIGSFNSDMVLSVVSRNDHNHKVSAAPVSKALSQATLFSTSKSEETIEFFVQNNTLTLNNKSVNCAVALEGDPDAEYSITLSLETLRQALSNYSEDTIQFAPAYTDGDLSGIIFWSDDLTTSVAGME